MKNIVICSDGTGNTAIKGAGRTSSNSSRPWT